MTPGRDIYSDIEKNQEGRDQEAGMKSKVGVIIHLKGTAVQH